MLSKIGHRLNFLHWPKYDGLFDWRWLELPPRHYEMDGGPHLSKLNILGITLHVGWVHSIALRCKAILMWPNPTPFRTLSKTVQLNPKINLAKCVDALILTLDTRREVSYTAVVRVLLSLIDFHINIFFSGVKFSYNKCSFMKGKFLVWA